MSYSFSFRAADKQAAKVRVAEELEKVATQQTCHAADKVQAQAAADAFIDILPDSEVKEVSVSMSGYLSGQWTGSQIISISGASVSVNVALVDKLPAA